MLHVRAVKWSCEHIFLYRGPRSSTQLLSRATKAAASSYDYDLIIIGCGVGGHGAALHAVEQGMKVAVIEGHDIGGTCVNRGCVPSKALLAASGRVRDFRNEMHLKSLGIQVGLSLAFKQCASPQSCSVQAVQCHVDWMVNYHAAVHLRRVGIPPVATRKHCCCLLPF